MRRRSVLARCGLALAAVVATPVFAAGPSYRVPLRQIEGALAQRFPRRYPVAGLFDVSIDVPRLTLLPDLNRIASDLPVEAAGPALRRRYSGSVAVDFGLRYEPGDRTIRAHHVRLESLRIDGLAGDARKLIEQSIGDLARDSMAEVVLHQVDTRDLALPDAMGLQPGAITVTADGIVIDFVNKTNG